MHERPITFPRTGDGRYTNAETNVAITRRLVDGRRFWEITIPGLTATGTRRWASRPTLAAARVLAVEAARVIRNKAGEAYADAAEAEVLRVERRLSDAVGAGFLPAHIITELSDRLTAARGFLLVGAHDRGRAFARVTDNALTVHLSTLTVGRTHRINLTRTFREITNSGLSEALRAANRYIETEGRLENALRARDHEAALSYFGDLAYLSPAFVEARPTQSHQNAMQRGRRALIEAAHAEALDMDPTAGTVIITDDLDGERYADEVREALRAGRIGDDGAVLALMEHLGVTWEGAVALIDAESTAALA